MTAASNFHFGEFRLLADYDDEAMCEFSSADESSAPWDRSQMSPRVHHGTPSSNFKINAGLKDACFILKSNIGLIRQERIYGSNVMSDCGCSVEVESSEQGRLLWILLAVNGVMFVTEISIGFLAESMGLIADSLDMLADATVYGIGLYAVGRSHSIKIKAASISGYFQVILGIGILAEIVRRFIYGSEPEPTLMICISVVALIANIVCLALISKHRDGEIHMRASWIFSKNDVIANSGVIIAGIMVHVLDSHLPDLLIGSVIVLVVLTGGLKIIGDARIERKAPTHG